MALIEQIVISLYFGIRFILQFWIPRGSITIKKCRIVLGVLWLPLGSAVYLIETIRYISIWTPGSLALPPVPVAFFVAWIIFLVADTLYQFHTISRIPKSSTSMS
ncbi:hypothetical protein EU528_10750 [Candidatus Thorarchaeota archaeon]|nr:MAG: hypothetical protein EU528_10750 [Candidatus Thorarchaeota archaeon]